MDDRSLILSSVHAAGIDKESVSLQVCDSPLCDIRFEQTGLAIEPRRFCSDQCRQQASLIRRVARLLEALPDVRVLQILRGKRCATALEATDMDGYVLRRARAMLDEVGIVEFYRRLRPSPNP